MSWLTWFYAHLLYCIAACGLLIVATVVFLIQWLRKHRIAEEPAAEPAPAGMEQSAAEESGLSTETYRSSSMVATTLPFELTVSFLRAIKVLRARTTGRQRLYQAPWYLLLGESGAGKTSLLNAVGGRNGAGEPGLRQGLGWRFFDRGVVLDVPGDYLLRPDTLSAHERSWRGLLRLLNRYRPLRAIDGVVLVLPARDFAPGTALDSVDLVRKATRIGEKLSQLQHESGLCFPVYVVVSKCDQVAGFQGFCQALPPERHREIFGWSSPYRAETAFESAWVDEAFERLVEDLNRVQSELFAERLEQLDPAALYFFPGEMLRLRDPIRAFLHQIFRPSAYRDAFHCRGIYFSGDGAAAPVSPVPLAALAEREAAPAGGLLGLRLAADRVAPRPAFVDDLFERKIFPEWGLAYPETRAFSFRHSAMLTAQNFTIAAVILLFGGLAWGCFRFNRLQHQAMPVLQLIETDLGESGASGTGHAQLQRNASDLVRSVAELGNDRFFSYFIPASWFSSLDSRIQDAVEIAFEKTVLQGVMDGLVQRAQAIGMAPSGATAAGAVAPSQPDPMTDAGGPDAGAADGGDYGAAVTAANLPLEQTPEYVALARFTNDVENLQDNIARYQHIIMPGVAGDVGNLNAVMKYLQPADAFQATTDNESYLAKALDAATGNPIPADVLAMARQRVATEMTYRVDALFSARFLHSPILATLQDLSAKIDALQDSSHYSFEDLKDLQSALDATDAMIDNPQSAWMAGRDADLDAPVRRVTLDPIERSMGQPYALFYPPADLAAYVRNNADADWQKLHDDLTAQQTDLTGPLLQYSGNSVRLSPGVDNLRLPIVDLMGMSFMAGHPNGSIPSPLAAGGHLTWDPIPLQEAQDMVTAYNRYLNEGLLDAPLGVRDAFRRVALEHLTANLIDQIDQAASWTPDDPTATNDTGTAAEIKSLQAAQPLLNDMLRDFAQVGQNSARVQLMNLLHAQAYRLLRQLDAQFDAAAPYTAYANLDTWDGSGPPSLAAFDLQAKDDLSGYLSFERAQTEALAAAAGPMVGFLQQSAASSRSAAEAQLTGRWQALISTVQKYDDKVPGNSLSALEEYIASGMDATTPASSCQPAPPPQTAPDPDYFMEARAQLRKTVYTRCIWLSADTAHRDYTSVANLFNQTLAGRFPFAAPGAGAVEADPDAIVAFYSRLDQVPNGFNENLGPTPAAAFIKQMEALRPYWAAFVSGQAQARVPVFDITPTFRVNRQRERGGNQIIAWTLRVGSQTVQSDQPTQAERWRLGDRISLTLQWAKDAPEMPVAPAGAAAAGVVVRDHAVTFEYNDPWALFSMLARQKTTAADFDYLEDPAPITLTFTVPTTPVTPVSGPVKATGANKRPPAPASVAVTAPSKVFIRIAIMIPGKVESLPVPEIPLQAPTLDANAYASTVSH